MTLFPLPSFGSVLAAIVVVYDAVLSCIALIAVACDKQAARQQRRRIPERSLHCLSVAGGWPGAWLGYRLFRHKTQKSAFQWMFRLTVAVNCALHGAALAAILAFMPVPASV